MIAIDQCRQKVLSKQISTFPSTEELIWQYKTTFWRRQVLFCILLVGSMKATGDEWETWNFFEGVLSAMLEDWRYAEDDGCNSDRIGLQSADETNTNRIQTATRRRCLWLLTWRFRRRMLARPFATARSPARSRQLCVSLCLFVFVSCVFLH